MASFIMTFNMDILLSDNVSLKDKYLDFCFALVTLSRTGHLLYGVIVALNTI